MVIGLSQESLTGVDHKPVNRDFFPYKKAILLSIENFLGRVVRQKNDYFIVVF